LAFKDEIAVNALSSFVGFAGECDSSACNVLALLEIMWEIPMQS
jgi:hypothetical protein